MFWEDDNKTSGLEFRQFLAEQIALPQERWDERFGRYIEQKYRETLQEIPERSPEEELESNFQRYLTSLDLNEEDLFNKRILDLGCGEGDFVKFCLGQGISRDIYGLDIEIEPEELNQGYRRYFLKGDFERELPINEMDYIVSVAGVEAPQSDDITRELRKILVLALTAIKNDGEIRIFPVCRPAVGSGLRTIEFSFKRWVEILESLSTKKLIDYEFRPIDIGLAGDRSDVRLEQVLIIKRKHILIK